MQKKSLSIKDVCIMVLDQANCTNQKEIIQHLLNITGRRITQSTLSRTLSAIGAIKVRNSMGIKVYKVIASEGFKQEQGTVKSLIKSIYHNNDWVLIKTEYGCAKLITKLIEIEPDFVILGCVAGSDTVIVAPRDTGQLEFCLLRVKEKLGFS
ncbi:hypothetical protein BST98_18870 [Photobacterium damselae]|nr:hypothetical protein BST98_18870 [Photobacterium damselae]